jgi:hypothetical protein
MPSHTYRRISASALATNVSSQHHSPLAHYPFGLIGSCCWSRCRFRVDQSGRTTRQHAVVSSATPPRCRDHLLRNRDHVVASTPHTTATSKLYICPLPARHLSGRVTVSSPLCSQPRVVHTRCIGSRRLPPPDQSNITASSFDALTLLPYSWDQKPYAAYSSRIFQAEAAQTGHNEGAYSMR